MFTLCPVLLVGCMRKKMQARTIPCHKTVNNWSAKESGKKLAEEAHKCTCRFPVKVLKLAIQLNLTSLIVFTESLRRICMN